MKVFYILKHPEQIKVITYYLLCLYVFLKTLFLRKDQKSYYVFIIINIHSNVLNFMPANGDFATMDYFPILNKAWNHKITFGLAFEFLYFLKE